ncbi:MAG TPA: N-acetylmuramic acid 6-phosphate etherase [Bacteroidia bacterium]|nr:N-acetylmuramic acid 6-phosphate etherase [Bacteroidia bacterium]
MATRVTESDSKYEALERMSVSDLLLNINNEDQTVADAVRLAIPAIIPLIEHIIAKMETGGRLFYIGAGTSGRLGIVDASECPPTFGVEQGRVIGIIAGGDSAIRKAVEFAEDDPNGGWNDLKSCDVNNKDVVVGIAASGSTPYVVGALEHCKRAKITTGSITCNPDAEVTRISDYPVTVVVGPEFVSGSTRMKAGTAQKLVLNMISTAVMIRLGRVRGNKMVDMQLTNNKLIDRGVRMIMDELGVSEADASKLLKQFGSVRNAVDSVRKNNKG